MRPDEDGSAATLPGTRDHVVAGAGGATYRLRLYAPEGPPPPGGRPLICLLDPNACFATLVEANRRMANRPAATGVHPAVIVGIGHAGDDLYDQPRRRSDYTLPGAEDFLAFVADAVPPFVAARHPVDLTRTALIGHSLAGWFCLWAMTRRPRAFAAHVALSPSVWWDEALLLSGIERLDGAGPRALVGVGEWEGRLAPWQAGRPGSETIAARREERDMIGGSRRVAERLAGRIGAERVAFTVFPDEDHASVVSVGLARALRFVFDPHPQG